MNVTSLVKQLKAEGINATPTKVKKAIAAIGEDATYEQIKEALGTPQQATKTKEQSQGIQQASTQNIQSLALTGATAQISKAAEFVGSLDDQMDVMSGKAAAAVADVVESFPQRMEQAVLNEFESRGLLTQQVTEVDFSSLSDFF
jgi:ABC-type hemin transport system substrate-binding protein